MVLAADFFGEGRTDSPMWNESVWFSVLKPEDQLLGALYYYFRPNIGQLNGGPILWDPSGSTFADCLYFDWRHLQAMPDGHGRDKFNQRMLNTFEVRTIEPITRYKIDYDLNDCLIDLTWQANGPLHVLKAHDDVLDAANAFHFEQPGTMAGTIRVRGREFRIDGFSMRDGSSGVRDFNGFGGGGYWWGIAENSSFHAMCMGLGRAEKLIGGFVYKDGVMGSIVSGERRILEHGRYSPAVVEFDAVDTHGREMRATGRIGKGLIFNGYPGQVTMWSPVEWDWDGVRHDGDNQDFFPAEVFRAIARGERPVAQ